MKFKSSFKRSKYKLCALCVILLIGGHYFKIIKRSCFLLSFVCHIAFMSPGNTHTHEKCISECTSCGKSVCQMCQKCRLAANSTEFHLVFKMSHAALSRVPCRSGKKNKPLLNVQVNGGVNGWDDSLSRSPLLSARSPYIIPNTPTHLGDPAGRGSRCYLKKKSII